MKRACGVKLFCHIAASSVCSGQIYTKIILLISIVMIFTQLHYFICNNIFHTIIQTIGEISKIEFDATENKALLR